MTTTTTTMRRRRALLSLCRRVPPLRFVSSRRPCSPVRLCLRLRLRPCDRYVQPWRSGETGHKRRVARSFRRLNPRSRLATRNRYVKVDDWTKSNEEKSSWYTNAWTLNVNDARLNNTDEAFPPFQVRGAETGAFFRGWGAAAAAAAAAAERAETTSTEDRSKRAEDSGKSTEDSGSTEDRIKSTAADRNARSRSTAAGSHRMTAEMTDAERLQTTDAERLQTTDTDTEGLQTTDAEGTIELMWTISDRIEEAETGGRRADAAGKAGKAAGTLDAS
jgi:hypothetical protein